MNVYSQMTENKVYGYVWKLGFSKIHIANEEDDCEVVGRLK